MKKRLSILALIISEIVCAQVHNKVVLLTDKKGDEKIMVVEKARETPVSLEKKIFNSTEVDSKVDYPNGLDAFYVFFYKNYNKPDEEGLNGIIKLSIVVEKDGSITNLKVLRDIGFGTGSEAIRVLKMTQKWIPAEIKGIKVRSLYLLRVSIK